MGVIPRVNIENISMHIYMRVSLLTSVMDTKNVMEKNLQKSLRRGLSQCSSGWVTAEGKNSTKLLMSLINFDPQGKQFMIQYMLCECKTFKLGYLNPDDK